MATPATPAAPPAKRPWRQAGLIVLLLGVVALAGWMIVGQLRAWQSQSAGKAALASGDLPTAIEQLEAARRTYPEDGELCFLLSQAYRRNGEGSKAERMLDEAKRIGWAEQALDLERALIRVQSEGLAPVEKALDAALASDHPEAANICEAMLPAVLERYDLGRAEALLQQWRKAQPGNGQADYWTGRVAEARHDKDAALASYRKVVESLPRHDEARRAMARLLMERDAPKEATPHLERLLKGRRDDAGLQRLRADWLASSGRADEARALLDRMLEPQPNSPELLRLRGKAELEDGQPLKAAEWLRRAVALKKNDPAILRAWLRCLEATGPQTQADDVKATLARVQADLAGVPALAQESARKPTDPEPRRKIGEILLRNDQETEGLRWLESALRVAPKDGPTNLVLAVFFEKKGDRNRAAHFRRAAQGKP